jgi:DNA repair/transcription protein MET18/MMS19
MSRSHVLALKFLASTLKVLDKHVLVPSHSKEWSTSPFSGSCAALTRTTPSLVKLLVTFFGAMFSVDHKAGILPSTEALAIICSMKAFPAHNGHDIIMSVCAMGDDFQKQVVATRLAIIALFHQLVSDPKVRNDLRKRHSDYDFIKQMLDLLGNERDPQNLIRWFSVLEVFLQEYAPPPELKEKIFTAYSVYFPISLRTSKHPSGITPEDLKLALRRCFAADESVAAHVIPFLVQKLNQGEGVSVDVKVCQTSSTATQMLLPGNRTAYSYTFLARHFKDD